MHHKHRQKEGGESFGLLIVPIRYWDKVKHDEARQVEQQQVTPKQVHTAA
jgi:beta-carotene 3-hydroxylase